MDKNIKGFFDTVLHTANAVGETVAEVTKESAKLFNMKKDAAKLNMEILRVRASIEEAQKEIGRESYEIYKSTDELDAEERQVRIDELLESIDGRYKQIARFVRQAELLNGGQPCTSCGKISPEQYEFCPACGTRLAKNTPPSKTEEASCCSCNGCYAPEEEDLDEETEPEDFDCCQSNGEDADK